MQSVVKLVQFLIFSNEFMQVFSCHKHDWMIGFSIHGLWDHDRVYTELVSISLLSTRTLNIQEAGETLAICIYTQCQCLTHGGIPR